jgi:flagellar motor switch protein FliG
MNLSNDGLRKAAILVSSLDTAAADALLDQLPGDEAQRVRALVVELDLIEPAEQRRVIDEFFRAGSPPTGRPPAAATEKLARPVPVSSPAGNASPLAPPRNPAGIDLDGRLAQTIAERARREGRNRPEQLDADGRQAAPFQFLQEAEAEKLKGLLATERPQTIALVLSHLPPERAGSVLARLPAATQVEVVHRLMDLEETAPEILYEVEEALQSRLSEQVQIQRRRVAGIGAVAAILAASDRRSGGQILDSLAAHDPALAERLGPRKLDFDDLTELDDASLAEVFRSAERELILPALVGARQELVARVLGQLPSGEATRLRRQLAAPGPLRLGDVDQARRELARLAHSLLARRTEPLAEVATAQA